MAHIVSSAWFLRVLSLTFLLDLFMVEDIPPVLKISVRFFGGISQVEKSVVGNTTEGEWGNNKEEEVNRLRLYSLIRRLTVLVCFLITMETPSYLIWVS